MAGSDLNFDVVYRGETFEYRRSGQWVFFQREKVHGGGYWFGQAFDECFVFGIEQPVSLREGMEFLSAFHNARAIGDIFDQDAFELTGD